MSQEDGTQSIVVASCLSLEEAALIETITRVAEQVKKAGASRTIIAFPAEVACARARVISEIALKRHNITADIFADRTQRLQHRRELGAAKSRAKPSSLRITPTDKMTLADIVKGLHKDVDPTSMGVKVYRMEQTRSGEVHLVYNENNPSRNEFLKKVQAVVGEEVKCQLRTTSVIVSDIEAGATEEETTTKLAKALGAPVAEFKAGRISQGPRGRSLVVTLPQDLAHRAIEMRSFSQTWTRATIREKIDPDFCSNCQEYGHKKCNKTPVERRCFNCGKTGHARAVCKNATACYVCKADGHRANSMACPAFRRLVHAKRSQC